jgi:2-dehydropantoate 2-reductase
MKWIVLGPGAVGGYFGARLSAAGEDVSFLARGRTLSALRATGLRVDSVLGDVTLPTVKASDDPSELGVTDVVLLAVKGWQLESSLPAIEEFARRGATILPLLNGVEAEAILSSRIPRSQLMLGLCAILSTVVQPGHIHHFGMIPKFALGEIDNSQSPRALTMLAALKAAGVDAAIPPDIHVALWEKFMFIAGLGSVSAAARSPVGIVRSTPQTRSLLESAIREIHTLGRAAGVRLADDAIARTLSFIDSLPQDGTTSMQRDLAAGKPSELDLLTGSVVRLGRKHNVPVPIHETLYAVLLPTELAARHASAS